MPVPSLAAAMIWRVTMAGASESSGSVLAPVAETLGWKVLDFDAERSAVRVEFQGRESFLNRKGTIQGGMLAAMLDSAMGTALALVLPTGVRAATLELKTSFLRATGAGMLVGEGRVVQRGRSICFVEGALRNAAGELVATASATARVSSAEPGDG
jgi:uncharacterized protein (TIGR00369 family)